MSHVPHEPNRWRDCAGLEPANSIGLVGPPDGIRRCAVLVERDLPTSDVSCALGGRHVFDRLREGAFARVERHDGLFTLTRGREHLAKCFEERGIFGVERFPRRTAQK